MLSPAIARHLRELGHDVVAVKERADWIASSDDDLIQIARAQQRAIVTGNVRDYRPRAAVAVRPGGPGHPGLIYLAATFRRTRADIGRIVDALRIHLEANPADDALFDRELWL